MYAYSTQHNCQEVQNCLADFQQVLMTFLKSFKQGEVSQLLHQFFCSFIVILMCEFNISYVKYIIIFYCDENKMITAFAFITVDPMTHAFRIDEQYISLHGVNVVYKEKPYIPMS